MFLLASSRIPHVRVHAEDFVFSQFQHHSATAAEQKEDFPEKSNYVGANNCQFWNDLMSSQRRDTLHADATFMLLLLNFCQFLMFSLSLKGDFVSFYGLIVYNIAFALLKTEQVIR